VKYTIDVDNDGVYVIEWGEDPMLGGEFALSKCYSPMNDELKELTLTFVAEASESRDDN